MRLYLNYNTLIFSELPTFPQKIETSQKEEKNANWAPHIFYASYSSPRRSTRLFCDIPLAILLNLYRKAAWHQPRCTLCVGKSQHPFTDPRDDDNVWGRGDLNARLGRKTTSEPCDFRVSGVKHIFFPVVEAPLLSDRTWKFPSMGESFKKLRNFQASWHFFSQSGFIWRHLRCYRCEHARSMCGCVLNTRSSLHALYN